MIRMSTPAWLLTCALVACDEGRTPLDLDQLITPDYECVELVHESLDLGGPIVAFASDIAGSPGGWALVSTVLDVDPVLVLVRVPARVDEPLTAPIVVANTPLDAPQFHLRAGLELGTAWLLRGVDSSQPGPVVLRKLAPGVGVIASNGVLDNFPADESGAECPDRWWRQLVLIEGRPFMLAIPDCSDGPGVELQLLALDEQNLDFLTNWTLAFDPCAGLDPLTCAQVHAYRLLTIGPGQSTHLPDASRVAIGFTQVRAFDEGLPSTGPILMSSDISLLDLRVDANGPDARLLTFREVWSHVTPFPLGPVELAQDHDSLQIFVPNLADRSESVLVRLDAITDVYLAARGAEVLPHAGEGALIQFARESAVLDVDVDWGRLHATPLVDVEVWGSFASRVLFEQDDLIGFESAGPGMLLLRRSEHPEQLLHVACMQDE
jgi:hypothetical protein